MATSFTSPGLVKATSEALVLSAAEINIARLFANDMSAEFADYGTTVKVPVIKGAAAGFDISTNDYENSAGSVSYASIVLDQQPKATFEFKGADVLEAPNAPYWNKCAVAGANAVKSSISQTLGGLFTTSACTGGTHTIGAITKANIAKLRTACKGRIAETVLALDPVSFAELLSILDSSVYGGEEAIRKGYIEGLYGFKAVVPMYDLPVGVKGALIPENAVAVASRAVAVADEGVYTEFGVATDDFGFAMTTMRHGSAAKGKGFMNMTSLWGAAIVDGSVIVALD